MVKSGADDISLSSGNNSGSGSSGIDLDEATEDAKALVNEGKKLTKKKKKKKRGVNAVDDDNMSKSSG